MSSTDEKKVVPWEIPVVAQNTHAANETEKQAETARELAYQQGFEKGLQDGMQAGQERVQQEIDILKTLIQSLQRPLELIDENLQQKLLHLCMEICRQLLRQNLSVQPEQIQQFLEMALQELPNYDSVCLLTINGLDREIVEKYLSSNDKSSIELRFDDNLDRGEFEISTLHTKIDGRFQSRLAELAKGIFDS